MAAEMPQLEGVEHRFVDAGGVRIHLAEAGEGEPLLLLHGWPQHWYEWHRVIEPLAPRYRLLMPDLRGFGWSAAPGSGYDGETFARDQIALLDALGIERVKLIGHDWGGWTGILLGLLHSERIERMIVCNAPHPWPALRPLPILDQAWRAWYTWIIATPRVGPAALRRDFPRVILTHGNVGEPFSAAEVEAFLAPLRQPEQIEATIALYRYYQRTFRQAGFGSWRGQRLTVPSLLLFGQRDLYISPRLITDPGGRAAEMRIELVGESGHFIANEKPELVAERAVEFFG